MKVKTKMKHLLTIIISATVAYATLFGMYNYLPVKYLTVESNQKLGATITTILATDKLSDSRSVINTNFANLNDNKIEMSTTSVASITTLGNLASANSLTSATSLATLNALTSATSLTSVGTITTGTWNALFTAAVIDGDDINSNIGGRSITLTSASPDTIDADVELYTFTIAVNMFATSTADGISTTSEAFVSLQIPTASTITRFTCYTDDAGTSTIRASVSTDGISAGTDILYSTGTECGADEEIATTTFFTTAIGARDWIHFYVSDAEPTGSRPRVIYMSFEATKND